MTWDEALERDEKTTTIERLAWTPSMIASAQVVPATMSWGAIQQPSSASWSFERTASATVRSLDA